MITPISACYCANSSIYNSNFNLKNKPLSQSFQGKDLSEVKLSKNVTDKLVKVLDIMNKKKYIFNPSYHKNSVAMEYKYYPSFYHFSYNFNARDKSGIFVQLFNNDDLMLEILNNKNILGGKRALIFNIRTVELNDKTREAFAVCYNPNLMPEDAPADVKGIEGLLNKYIPDIINDK